ncbi:peptide/nickel transport system permease protein [Arboricoccus pini]|uniref:Peptide/nickel transport system permease protein n=1 Tax=Arboricoccus pini TaxID=1963835 RepID=A0A212REX0_9PROT|nr:ABC transporter permease [Arboricoccus pini]SNB70914.1 peptide/nickel transport system permease protein [Arboricoccus pini]
MTASVTGQARAASERQRSIFKVPLSVALSVLVALFFVAAAITPAALSTHSPFDTDLLSSLTPPASDHLLGTDDIGRDLYSRIIWGTRQSLLIGLGAMAVALTSATVLGFAAALAPRWIAEPIDRILEILLAFPTLLLALLFVALLGPSATSLLFSVGIGTAPGYARLIRAQTLKVKSSGYVEAAWALGHPGHTIFRQHIAPNAFRPLVALFALGIGQSVVWASGLSFLGLGVAPPSPEWGALLEAGKANITVAWWLEIFPGVAIVFVALSFTQIGRYIQDRLEGTLHQ